MARTACQALAKGPAGWALFRPAAWEGWAAGRHAAQRLPDTALRLAKKRYDLVIQTHFHPSGKVETEQASVGLYFAKKPPEKLFISMMRGLKRAQPSDIPAGDKNFELSDSFIRFRPT